MGGADELALGIAADDGQHESAVASVARVLVIAHGRIAVHEIPTCQDVEMGERFVPEFL